MQRNKVHNTVLKERGPICSAVFQTLRDFSINRKLNIVFQACSNVTVKKHSVKVDKNENVTSYGNDNFKSLHSKV